MIEKIWHYLLTSGDTKESLVNHDEVDDVVSLMVKFRINLWKFAGNLNVLLNQEKLSRAEFYGRERNPLSSTPSIYKLTSRLYRPLEAPLWLLAAFPDIFTWFNEKLHLSIGDEERSESITRLLGVDPDSLSNSNQKPNRLLRAYYYGNLISNYLKETGEPLEVAVQEGSEDDIYIGMDLLQHMAGKERSFTLNKKIELIKQLLKRRIENDLSLIEKYRDRPVTKVDDLPEIILMGLPEGTIVSIVEIYWMIKKKTKALDREIFEAIEKHRSIHFQKPTPSPLPLTLSNYIKYRLSIEHSQGPPFSSEFVDEAIDLVNKAYR